MKTALLMTTAAFASLFAGPIVVLAQQAMPSAEMAAPEMTAAAMAPAPVISDPGAPLGSEANPIPRNSPTPVGEAGRLVAGDPTVVLNAPIPDTKANRARYGQPLSATGRASEPAGNWSDHGAPFPPGLSLIHGPAPPKGPRLLV